MGLLSKAKKGLSKAGSVAQRAVGYAERVPVAAKVFGEEFVSQSREQGSLGEFRHQLNAGLNPWSRSDITGARQYLFGSDRDLRPSDLVRGSFYKRIPGAAKIAFSGTQVLPGSATYGELARSLKEATTHPTDLNRQTEAALNVASVLPIAGAGARAAGATRASLVASRATQAALVAGAAGSSVRAARNPTPGTIFSAGLATAFAAPELRAAGRAGLANLREVTSGYAVLPDGTRVPMGEYGGAGRKPQRASAPKQTEPGSPPAAKEPKPAFTSEKAKQSVDATARKLPVKLPSEGARRPAAEAAAASSKPKQTPAPLGPTEVPDLEAELLKGQPSRQLRSARKAVFSDAQDLGRRRFELGQKTATKIPSQQFVFHRDPSTGDLLLNNKRFSDIVQNRVQVPGLTAEMMQSEEFQAARRAMNRGATFAGFGEATAKPPIAPPPVATEVRIGSGEPGQPRFRGIETSTTKQPKTAASLEVIEVHEPPDLSRMPGPVRTRKIGEPASMSVEEKAREVATRGAQQTVAAEVRQAQARRAAAAAQKPAAAEPELVAAEPKPVAGGARQARRAAAAAQKPVAAEQTSVVEARPAPVQKGRGSQTAPRPAVVRRESPVVGGEPTLPSQEAPVSTTAAAAQSQSSRSALVREKIRRAMDEGKLSRGIQVQLAREHGVTKQLVNRVMREERAARAREVAARATTQAVNEAAVPPKPSVHEAAPPPKPSVHEAAPPPKQPRRTNAAGQEEPQTVGEQPRVEQEAVPTEPLKVRIARKAQEAAAVKPKSSLAQRAAHLVGLKPFPKKTVLAIGGATAGAVVIANRDQLGAGTSAPSEQELADETFLEAVPEDIRENVRALMAVKRKKGEAGLQALVEGRNEAMRNEGFPTGGERTHPELSERYAKEYNAMLQNGISPEEAQNYLLKRVKAKEEQILRESVRRAYQRIKTKQENERLRRS
jgi:hypothetical protein